MQQLVNYIKKNLSKGYTIEALRWALINQDYPRVEIEKAINLTNEQLGKEAPILKEKPVIKYEAEPIETLETSFWQKIKNWFK